MSKFIRQAAAAAAFSVATLWSPVQAASVTIDFEGDDLTGLYFPGDSFSQGGFTMTANYDFGVIGMAGDLGDAGPSGNSTQFYFNSNDGYLTLRATEGGTFSLDGFSAAFVPLIPSPVPDPTIVIVAVGIPEVGGAFGTFFGFGASETNSFPFLAYGNPADFGRFNNLVEVQFFACVLDNSICATPTQNNGQFALDDVRLTLDDVKVVPEPSSMLLAMLALAAVARTTRRRTHSRTTR
jgi:PEP-CTERM motif